MALARIPGPSRQAQVHAEHPGESERQGQQDEQHKQEDGNDPGAHAQQRLPVDLRLLLVVMPLDGEVHTRNENQTLEENEDDKNPIHWCTLAAGSKAAILTANKSRWHWTF